MERKPPGSKKTKRDVKKVYPRLRRQAEELLRLGRDAFPLTETGDLDKLLHELRVHQIELKLQNEELQRAYLETEGLRHKYFNLYDLAPVGYFSLDQNGKILELNLAAAAMLSNDRAALMNRRFQLFVSPNEIALFNDFLKKILTHQTKQSCELSIVGNGALPVQVRIEGVSGVQDSAQGVACQVAMMDMTECKALEEDLRSAHDELESRVRERTNELARANEALCTEIDERREAENKIFQVKCLLQNVFDGISEPLMLVDRLLTVRMLNEAACTYYHLASAEEAVGRSCPELAHGSCTPCDNCLIKEGLKTGKSFTFERESILYFGHVEEVTVYSGIQGVNDAPGGIIRIRDITEKKNMETHLMRSDRLSSLGLLSGGIAHEIRNPLAGINLLVDFLSDEERFTRSSQELTVLSDIKDNIRKINRIIKGVLDFSRLPEAVAPQRVELGPLVRDSVNLLRPKMTEKPIEIRLLMEEDLPAVFADSIEIQQVLINLIQNAIDAMRTKGVVQITAGKGTLSFDTTRPAVIIKVQDSGSGIPLEIQQNIFNPFFTTKPTGSGLGLAISHRIISRNGGIISFESKPGVGTTFRVELPATPQRSETPT